MRYAPSPSSPFSLPRPPRPSRPPSTPTQPLRGLGLGIPIFLGLAWCKYGRKQAKAGPFTPAGHAAVPALGVQNPTQSAVERELAELRRKFAELEARLGSKQAGPAFQPGPALQPQSQPASIAQQPCGLPEGWLEMRTVDGIQYCAWACLQWGNPGCDAQPPPPSPPARRPPFNRHHAVGAALLRRTHCRQPRGQRPRPAAPRAAYFFIPPPPPLFCEAITQLASFVHANNTQKITGKIATLRAQPFP